MNNPKGNDLDSYKKFVIRNRYKDVKVIVLSLHEKVKTYKCIYITHIDYVNCICKNLPNYEAQGNAYYIDILKQFIENVKNVTMEINAEQIDFLYQYYEEAEKVHTLYQQVVDSYKNALKNLTIKNYTSKFDKNGWVYLTLNGNESIKLTIFFLDRKKYEWKNHENKPYFTVILELQGREKDIISAIITHKKDKKEEYKKLEEIKSRHQLYYGEKLNWECGHFASWNIEIEDKNDRMPNKFVELVKKEIEEDSCGICKLAEEIKDFCSKLQSSYNTVLSDN